MKRSFKLFYLQLAAIALVMSFAVSAHAESAREEITHAYILMGLAHHDYDGHKGKAMEELKAISRELKLSLESVPSEPERQWKSDEQLTEARRLLRDARNRFEDSDRDRAAAHVERAIKEIDICLAVK